MNPSPQVQPLHELLRRIVQGHSPTELELGALNGRGDLTQRFAAMTAQERQLKGYDLLAEAGLFNDEIRWIFGPDEPLAKDPPSKAELDILRTAAQTDAGNADCIAALQSKSLRYCPDTASWLFWDGARWQPDRDGVAIRAARDTARARYHAAAEIQVVDARMKLAKWATTSENASKVEGALKMAKAHEALSVTIEHFDTDPMLAATPTATIDLRKGEARLAKRDDFITMQLGTSYNADITCPRWLQFLGEIFEGNMELIAYIQRAVGYSLTGDTSEQKLFLCYGSGANGKSVFLQVLAWLAGDYHATASFETFDAENRDSKRDDLAALRGKRVVSIIESDEDRRMAEARVKAVTGQDAISCRHLYGRWFSYRPAFKIWLAMNHRPVITGTDYGIWRRIVLIPFLRTFADHERDAHLADKLRNELPGILNWAIEGAKQWQAHRLGKCQVIEQALEDYRSEMDVIGQWLGDCTIGGVDLKMRAIDGYGSYQAWCTRTGTHPMKMTAWGRRLTDRSIQKERDGKGWFYRGIGLVSIS